MAQPLVAVIDYEMGNIRSVSKALEVAGAEVKIVSKASELKPEIAALVLPGVGAFRIARRNLKKRGLWQKLSEYLAVRKKPFLGICLGLQLLMTKSYEGGLTSGLNIFPGTVVRFPSGFKKYPVPHIGWNTVYPVSDSEKLWSEIPSGTYFYFNHSYYVCPRQEKIVAAYCDYGKKFAASLLMENIFACQFHPEKSGRVGLKLLKNFLRWLRCW